jgi:hypothetical protein
METNEDFYDEESSDSDSAESNRLKRRARCVIVTPYGEHSHLIFPTKSSMTCSVLDATNSTYKRLSLEACEILNDLRCEQHLCDCVIKVEDGSEFAIHKVVLSGETLNFLILLGLPICQLELLLKATSSYFRALFTNGMNDTNKKIIEIKGIESSTMKLLIGNFIQINILSTHLKILHYS